MSLIQAIPLTIFLVFLRFFPPEFPIDWQLPFLVSGTAAAVATIMMVVVKKSR